MDPRIIRLYDEYTHTPLERRVFLERLAVLAGGTAAAMTLLPLLENNYAQAQIVNPADPRLATSTVTYVGANANVRGYLAVPKEGPPKRAGVIVIHENRGLTPYQEDIARRLAVEGYTGLAVDLLSPLGGTPANEDEARAAIGKLDRANAVLSLVAGVAYLKGRPDATGAVGAVGMCWGGGMCNLLAGAAPDLTAAVAYYGPVPPAIDVPPIRAKLLLHYAGNDPRINAGIPGYEKELKAARVSYELFMYEGAEHAFDNYTGGARYNKAAADLAWSRTTAFFKTNLG